GHRFPFGPRDPLKPRCSPSLPLVPSSFGGPVMRFLSAHLRLAAIVICLLIPSSLIASGFPKPLPKFPVGPLPAGVAVGDFNGDGKLDLVLVNQDHFTITAVLGRRVGVEKLASKTRFPSGEFLPIRVFFW